jgi:hypothetical protein
VIEPTQQDILRSLAVICELSLDVRFGQLLANLNLLTEDEFGRNLWEIENAELLQVLEKHKADLSMRQRKVA